MCNLLINAILCLFVNICKHFFALFKFVCNIYPACRSIVAFFQCFCFCNHCLKCSCIHFFFCWFYNICICCLELYSKVFVSKSIYGQCPVSCSVVSFWKLAAQGFCKAKLNTHRFVHPVICCKFCSVRCQNFVSLKCICASAVVSIVCPFNSLHCSTKISVSISCKVNSQELTIVATCFFYSCGNIFCFFEGCIFNT